MSSSISTHNINSAEGIPAARATLRPVGETSSAPSAPVASTLMEPSAPPASLVVGTAKPETPSFEWNTKRLFVDEEGCSRTRLWTVRILSTALVFPFLLTLLVDIGRRIAYSAGFINGKSWSLIDQTIKGFEKIRGAFQSCITPKEPTLEMVNQQFTKTILDEAGKLVDGYRALNGGYFHTTNSFSAPQALDAEKKIAKAKSRLIAEINAFVSRNAKKPEDYKFMYEIAITQVKDAIALKAGDDLFIPNKIVRSGPPLTIARVALKEFLAEDRNHEKETRARSKEFISLAAGTWTPGTSEAPFIASLKKGVAEGIINRNQATQAVQEKTGVVYNNGLKTGIEKANTDSKSLLQRAIAEKLITDKQAVQFANNIRPDVETLALAAAKDIARQETPQTTDLEVTQQLTDVAGKLKSDFKLDPKQESRFITSAKRHLSKAKEVVATEELRKKKEIQKKEAQKLAEVQKHADQKSLLNKFLSMLGLISNKQKLEQAQFVKFSKLDQERQNITDQLEEMRKTKVKINDVEMTVPLAANQYYAEVAKISNNKKLGAKEKNRQIQDLVKQGYSKQTIDKIKEMSVLDPKLMNVIAEMDNLSKSIDQNHLELKKLIAIFAVYKKNHFAELNQENQKNVEPKVAIAKNSQKELNRAHSDLLKMSSGKFLSRLRSEEAFNPPLEVDPEANDREVNAIVAEHERSLNPPAPPAPETPTAAPSAPPLPKDKEELSLLSRLYRSGLAQGKSVVTWPLKMAGLIKA